MLLFQRQANQQLWSLVVGTWHKCHALVHGIWLERGDQGVEFALRKISPRSYLAYDGNEFEHSWAPLEGLPAAQEARLTFRLVARTAKLMRCFDDLINMGHLSRLLRDPRARLLETCFSDPANRHFHQDISSFSAELVPGRWGSVAFCVIELCKLERILRYGWGLAKYPRPEAPGNYEGGVDVAVVNSAVTDPIFWGQLASCAGRHVDSHMGEVSATKFRRP